MGKPMQLVGKGLNPQLKYIT